MTISAAIKMIPLHFDPLLKVLKMVPPHLHKIDAAFNFGKALALKKTQEDYRFFRKFSDARHLLYKLDFISLIGNAIFVGMKAQENWAVVSIIRPFPHIIALTAVGIPLGLTYLSLKLINLINKIALKEIRIGEKKYPCIRPKREAYGQLLYAARIIVQLATLYFAPTNPFFILSAACEVYSLLKLTQRKWVEFRHQGKMQLEKNLELKNNDTIPNIPLSSTISTLYKFRILGQETASGECLECEGDNPSLSFCGKHFFHMACAFQAIDEKVKDFANQVSLHQEKIKRELTSSYVEKNKQLVEAEFEAFYEITLPRTSLPSCPTCQVQPEWNEFSATISDPLFGTMPLEIDFQ